jgi:hypothetical protein
MRRKLLRLYSAGLHHDWLIMVAGFVVLAAATGVKSSLLFYAGLLVVVVSRFAFIIERARSTRKRERLQVALRYDELRAADWPLTQPRMSTHATDSELSAELSDAKPRGSREA